MFEETWKSWNQSLKMPKATKSAQHEQHTIEHVLSEETSEQEEASSDQQEEDVEQEVNSIPPQALANHVYALYRGPKNGLNCQW